MCPGYPMKTNEITIIGRIVDRSKVVDLLVGESGSETEIQQIDFSIDADCGLVLQATARSDIGSAFYSLNIDRRFHREGTPVKATGYLIGDVSVMLIAETIQVETVHDALEIQDTDLKDLIAKAQDNFTLKRAELYRLLSTFDEGTPQHYAVALQLRRACRDTSQSTQIAEKICRCNACRQTFTATTPRYIFNFSKAYCSNCQKNVAFDLVDPLPPDPDETEKLSFEEIQKRIQSRFGN